MSKRILCLLGSKHFYGKERSNIEVYSLLKDQGDCVLKVVCNKKASDELKKYLSVFDIVPIAFPDRSVNKFKYLKYILTSLGLNFQILSTILKFRPDYIFLNDEKVFYDIGLPIYFFGKKVIYRIGDAPVFPKLENFRINAWIWKNIVLKKTDTFVYISEFIKKTVEATGRESIGDIVIYNYPPRRKKIMGNDAVKYVESVDLAFGYLGQLIPEKGVHLFVDAAVELLKAKKALHFYIAGDLNYLKEYADKLVKTVKDNHFEDRIVFLDNIDDVQTFFENIDVLVTPSIKQEPLGNVIVEAKKYATPSIIFKSGGMPELIAHGTNGFVCENPTKSCIVKGMEYYVSTPEMVEQHGNNAKTSIEELKIDYLNFKTKWLSVFELDTRAN